MQKTANVLLQENANWMSLVGGAGKVELNGVELIGTYFLSLLVNGEHHEAVMTGDM